MRGHMELRTTFTDGIASRTINIRYLVVSAPSAYNILLGRSALNRIWAVASTTHMKMKMSSLEGAVITIKSNQKAAKKCYENSLKTKRGVCSVTSQPKRGLPSWYVPGKATQACRGGAGEVDRGQEVQARQVSRPGSTWPDRRGDTIASRSLHVVCLVHAWHRPWFLEPSPHDESKGSTCPPETEEV